jgi:O-antigen ligase
MRLSANLDTRVAGTPSTARPATAATPAWVETLSVVVLLLTLIYAILGVPGDDGSDPTQTDHVNPFNSWIWLGLLGLSMPVLRQRWRDVLTLTLSNWALLLLFLYFAASISWALDPSVSLRRFIFTVVQLVLFNILVSGIRRPPLLHVAIVAACAIAAVADFAYWVVAPGLAMAEDGFAGLQSQKNQTGLLMMWGCLAAGSGFFLLPSRRWRIGSGGAALLMAALLVATRSTTSQSVVISAVLVMPVLLLIARLPKRIILAIAAIFVLVLLLVPAGYMAWCGITGMDPLLPLRGVTVSERKDIWLFVISEFWKRPLLGAGYSSLWAINPAVQPSLKTDAWFGLYTIINEGHNGYLDQLATGGIVGLLGALFVVFRSIVIAGRAVGATAPAAQAWRDGTLAYPTAAFHLAFLLGLIVHNFTESNLFNNNALLAVGFLLAAVDLEKWRLTRRPR